MMCLIQKSFQNADLVLRKNFLSSILESVFVEKVTFFTANFVSI